MGWFFQMPCDHFCSIILITCYLHMIVALVSLPKKTFYLSYRPHFCSFSPCRCGHSHNLCHPSIPVCSAALWHPPCRIPLRADRSVLAALHERNRLVQHHRLEPSCLPGTQSLLHDHIPEEDQEVWLDVAGRDFAMHDR